MLSISALWTASHFAEMFYGMLAAYMVGGVARGQAETTDTNAGIAESAHCQDTLRYLMCRCRSATAHA